MTGRLLTLLLLFPLLSFGQQQYFGSRVVGIGISGAETDSDLQRVPIHTGDILTEDSVRAAIQALYDTGRYSTVEADATSETGGVRLIFKVQRYYFFSTFRLEPDTLLDRSISGFIRLPVGEKFSQTRLDRLVAETADLLQSEGYFGAAVGAKVRFDESTRLATVILKAETLNKPRIRALTLEGGEETFSGKDRQDLLDALNIKAGDTFSTEKLDAGIAKVRGKFTELGFLNARIDTKKNYRADSNTVDLRLTIDPGQFTLVEARGYDISNKQLRLLVPVFEEGAVDPDLVEEGRTQIVRFMQQEGYFEASATSEVIRAELDNAVQINYTIDKGEQHTVREVRISGNRFFTEDELRARIKVRRAGLMDRGVFSPEILDQDARNILAMYRRAGFSDATVRPSSEEQNHVITISIEITEGERLPIKMVSFTGNRRVGEDELRTRTGIHDGQTYTPVVVEDARNALTTMYYAKGFPDVRVDAQTEQIFGGSGMHVTFNIVEGESYTIHEILVAGNTLTAEKIVHRNSNLYPNTPFNPEAILESQQKLYGTGLFTRVDIVALQQDLAGSKNVLIQLEDAKPILLTPGIGYQESDGLRGTLELSHINLFGLGRSINLRGRGSRNEQLFQATYRDPRLFNWDLEGDGSLLIERTHQPKYDSSRVDFTIQTVRQLATSQNLLLTASYQTVNLTDIRVNPRAEEFPETGVIQIARIGASYVRDKRDDPIDPSAGSFNTTTFQIASRAWKSEVNFTSLFNQSIYYRPLRGGAVLATSFRFGWNQPYGVTEQLPITERYFAGGSTTLRGFGLDKAGPEAGGTTMTIGNIEYRFPLAFIPIKHVGAALFYDTGNVFSRISDFSLGDFTHTAGYGFRYQTPLGPVRLDFGFNLNPKIGLDGIREDRFHVFFTLGHTF